MDEYVHDLELYVTGDEMYAGEKVRAEGGVCVCVFVLVWWCVECAVSARLCGVCVRACVCACVYVCVFVFICLCLRGIICWCL